MFTGIIKEIGEIIEVRPAGKSMLLGISCDKILEGMNIGDSISVDGICLTVNDISGKSFRCDVSTNTVGSTNLKNVSLKRKVNLEDALKASDKLGGHMVTGHVDTTVKLLKTVKKENAYELTIELPPPLRPYIAEKGSVALNGISLTVVEKKKDSFTVFVIPHTFNNTNI